MLLYYITDRRQFSGDDASQRTQLLDRIGEASRIGVDYIQLREKDFSARQFEALARESVQRVREHSHKTRILINSRIDIALVSEADGVHLTGSDISASDARTVLFDGSAVPNPVVAVSCHSPNHVRLAEAHGADFAVLAPIFEKRGTDLEPLGLDALRRSTGVSTPIDRRVEAGDKRHHLPVFALGGVTLDNAADCLRAGATGIAAIRLFQQGNLSETVQRLRAIQ